MIRVPLEVKEKLEERAAGRPIHKMISEDFLHEPDTEKLIKIKFDAIDSKLNEIKEQIEYLATIEIVRETAEKEGLPIDPDKIRLTARKIMAQSRGMNPDEVE